MQNLKGYWIIRKGFKQSFRYFYFQFDREHGKYSNEARYRLVASAWRYNNKRKPTDKKWHLMYNLWHSPERRALRSVGGYKQIQTKYNKEII